MNKHILVILAHQDDEMAFSTRISHELVQGNIIHCVFLTDGNANRINKGIRDSESLSVLCKLGVKTDNVYFIGTKYRIPDGCLPEHVSLATKSLELTLEGKIFHRVYCMAYEGGHQDHDASFCIAINFSTKRNLLNRTWQIPFYNGFKTNYKLFRVLVPIPITGRTLLKKLKFTEAYKDTLLVLNYKSQWKTWLGLLPEFLFQRVIKRNEILQSVNRISITQRPHNGLLLYERLFNYPYSRFNSEIKSIISSKND